MADRYISVLPQATYINDNDLFLLEQSGTSKKMLGSLLRNYVDRNIVTITINTVESTSPASVESYNQVTGELVLNLPKGVGIANIVAAGSEADPSYGGRVKRTYNVVLESGTNLPFYLYDGKDGVGTVNSVNGVLPDQYNNVTLIFEKTISISASATEAQIGSATDSKITAKTKVLHSEVTDNVYRSDWTVETNNYTNNSTPNLTINGTCSANTTVKLILAEVS